MNEKGPQNGLSVVAWEDGSGEKPQGMGIALRRFLSIKRYDAGGGRKLAGNNWRRSQAVGAADGAWQ